MTVRTNRAEGGTNGTTVTIGNSGGVSGDPFLAVTPGAGGTIQFTTAQAAHGSLSYAMSPAAAAAQSVLMSDGNTSTSFSTRFYARLTGYPSAETIFHDVQTAAGATIARLHLLTTGALKVVNSAGTGVGTFTNVMALNTWYRISLFGTVNATTGTINASLYVGDSVSATESKVLTAQNTGSTNAGRAGYGKLTPTPSLATWYLDDIQQNLESSTEIGVPVNSLPTVTGGANQTVAASTVANLSYTAFDSDGTIASLATAMDYPTSGAPAITGGTTATPSFTTGTPGPKLYVIRQTATDDLGGTGSGTTEVRVSGSGAIAPLANYTPVTSGTWTNTGGAANIGVALNDGSDATYVESAALSASSQEIRVRLDPSTTRSAMSVTFRVSQDTAGTIVAKGRLYEGTTLRQEWTLTTTTSAADQVCALSGGTVAAITDWGNLWAAVAGTA